MEFSNNVLGEKLSNWGIFRVSVVNFFVQGITKFVINYIKTDR